MKIKPILMGLIGFILIGCIYLSQITIELKPLSHFPSVQEDGTTDDKMYYWYPIRIKIPAKIPFTIETIELKNTEGQTTEDSVLIYVYDAEGKSDKGGAGYVTEDWLLENYPSIEISENLKLHTTDAYVFLLISPEAQENVLQEITMRYSWLGLFNKQTTATIQ